VESPRDGDKKGTGDNQQPASVPKSYEREREQLKSIVDDGRAQGFDLPKQAFVWAGEFYRGLPQEAQACFIDLCALGCHPTVIAALGGLVRYSPRLEKILEHLMGPRDERASTARKLEKAAEALETLAELNQDIGNETFTRTGQLHPKELLLQLRQRSQLLALPSMAEEFLGARSPVEFSRYLLTKYVDRSTSSPRDRMVSGLLTGIFDDASGLYNEENQRMWRLRHAERLDPTASPMVDYLIGMSPLFDVELPA
jgi:hypothetical protein